MDKCYDVDALATEDGTSVVVGMADNEGNESKCNQPTRKVQGSAFLFRIHKENHHDETTINNQPIYRYYEIGHYKNVIVKK